VIICVAGLGLLVASDHLTSKNYPAGNKPLGDGLMILGATLYGISNGLQECLVRQRPLYEVVGQMGFWGTIISGAQAAGLEHGIWKDQVWNRHTIGMLVAYTASMLSLYTVVPILFRLASSPFYNLSILTSDFWGLIFGLGLYHYQAYCEPLPLQILTCSLSSYVTEGSTLSRMPSR
jgi:solute carrier family 35 protein F1/2